jgi:DNA-binding transcriptional MerR regulator
MLRYVERVGLVQATRSPSGYRQYTAGLLQRLRTLRELLTEYDLGPSDVAFAMRLRTDPAMSDAVSRWLDAEPSRPQSVPASEWLRFEQAKCQRLLASITKSAA